MGINIESETEGLYWVDSSHLGFTKEITSFHPISEMKSIPEWVESRRKGLTRAIASDNSKYLKGNCNVCADRSIDLSG